MSTKSSPIESREIIPINYMAVKKEWVSYFDEINMKLEKAKREWNEFETEARATFQIWYHSTFAKDLTKVREIEEESEQIRRMFEAIDAQISINGLNKRDAYLKVEKAVDQNHDPFPTEEEVSHFKIRQTEKFHQDFKKRLGQNGKHDVDLDLLDGIRKETAAEAMRRFGPPGSNYEAQRMNEWIGDTIMNRYQSHHLKPVKIKNGTDEFANVKAGFFEVEDFEDEETEAIIKRMFGGLNEDDGTDDLPGDQKPEDYKALYRQIVRALHPDRGSEMSEAEKELWSQAQIAYREQDTSALKEIALRIEGGGKINIQAVESIGEIRELVVKLHFDYSEINFIKSKVKKEAVYRFWASRKRPANRKKLEAQMGQEFKMEIAGRNHELRELVSARARLKREFKKSGSMV
jgi:hypothetical protein